MDRIRGFTIVELLVVIVVIGILAAISIVSYNGIQDKAYNTQVMTQADQWQKVFEMYRTINGSYPLKSNPSNGTCVPLGRSASDFTKTTAFCYGNFDQGLIDSLVAAAGSVPKGGQQGGPSGQAWDGFRYRHDPTPPYANKRVEFLATGNSCGKFQKDIDWGDVSVCAIYLQG